MLTYLKYSPSELKALKIENNYKDLKEKDLVTLYANASKMAGFDITIAFAYATDAVTSVPPFSSVTAMVSDAGASSTVMSPLPFW